MDNFDTRYEAYKNMLLKKPYFMRKFSDLYKETLSAQRNYIDTNGVLWKIAFLSTAFGFTLFAGSKMDSTISNLLVVVLLIAYFILAVRIGIKYKDSSAERFFYCAQYGKYIQTQVLNDKHKESDALMKDIFDNLDAIRYCAVHLQNNTENSETLQNVLVSFAQNSDNFRERYKEISQYDQIAENLVDDFHFYSEIRKFIHQ